MKILITGASSKVGESLALAFAPGNEILLLGRDRQRLERVGAGCVQKGAVRFEIDPVDIASVSDEAWRKRMQGVALAIHAAFHGSGIRDQSMQASEMNTALAANLASPFGLFRAASEAASSGSPRSVILVSSFLAGLRSPNRLIYGSQKLLQEEYLRKLAQANPGLHALVVRVCTTIPIDRDSAKAGKFAQRVLAAYNSRELTATFGVAGRLFIFLFHLQPVVYYMLTSIQRWLRARAS